MPYAVQPIAAADDAPGLARTMMGAFHTDPHWRRVWLDMTLEQIIDSCAHRLPKSLTTDRGTKRHQKVVDAQTGEIVGYARWVLPPSLEDRVKCGGGGAVFWPEAQIAEPSAEQREAFEVEWEKGTEDGRNVGLNREMVVALGKVLEDEDRRVKGGEEFLELDYLATAPEHQNRGIGALLVKSGLEQADAVGVNTLVMASTSRGKKLYERLGFEHVSTIVQDDSKWGGSPTGSVNHWYIRRRV